MKLRSTLLLALLAAAALPLRADPDIHDTRLLSEPAVSAKQIAFIYAGDLWTCDLDGGNARRLTSGAGARSHPAFSPDGKWRVRVRETTTSEQLWLENTASGEARELAGGSCNNHSPAWELDSSAVIFASDCGRAFGLPALYRAPVN